MKDRLLRFEILLQGIGMLISWNAIMTALDWFSTEFPDYNVGVIFGMCNFGPGLIFQSLTVWKGNNFSYNKRVNGGYVVVGTILVLLPVVTVLIPGLVGLIVVSALILVLGSANAISQTTVFGIAGSLPGIYTNLIMIGNGVAGITITVVRLICLGGFQGTDNGLLYSTLAYFVISGIFIVICIFAQVHLMKHPMVRSALGGVQTGDTQPLDPLGEDPPSVATDVTEEFSWKGLFSRIWQYMFLVWLVFVVTFGVLTRVAIATDASEMPYAYFETLMFLTFNLFDFAGRLSTTKFMIGARMLWILVFCRFVFWLTFILVAIESPPDWLFSAIWFKFLNMAIFAYSNGYLSTCAMIYGPTVAPNTMKDRAGYSMATCLVGGIFCGTLVANGFSGIGTVPSD